MYHLLCKWNTTFGHRHTPNRLKWGWDSQTLAASPPCSPLRNSMQPFTGEGGEKKCIYFPLISGSDADRMGESCPCRAFGTAPALGCSHGKAACSSMWAAPWAQGGQALHVWVGSLGTGDSTGEPECSSCLHDLCTRREGTPGTGSGGSSLGSCTGHCVELRSGCFAFPASAHAAFLCWSYAEKLRFMYCMKKTKQKKRKNPNVPK